MGEEARKKFVVRAGGGGDGAKTVAALSEALEARASDESAAHPLFSLSHALQEERDGGDAETDTHAQEHFQLRHLGLSDVLAGLRRHRGVTANCERHGEESVHRKGALARQRSTSTVLTKQTITMYEVPGTRSLAMTFVPCCFSLEFSPLPDMLQQKVRRWHRENIHAGTLTV